MKKRLLALLLSLIMIVSVMPMSVFAVEGETPETGGGTSKLMASAAEPVATIKLYGGSGRTFEGDGDYAYYSAEDFIAAVNAIKVVNSSAGFCEIDVYADMDFGENQFKIARNMTTVDLHGHTIIGGQGSTFVNNIGYPTHLVIQNGTLISTKRQIWNGGTSGASGEFKNVKMFSTYAYANPEAATVYNTRTDKDGYFMTTDSEVAGDLRIYGNTAKCVITSGKFTTDKVLTFGFGSSSAPLENYLANGSYCVKFEPVGGSLGTSEYKFGNYTFAPAYKCVVVKSGSTIARPADPAKKNCVFDAWYKDQDCTEKWNFETDTVTENTTLYAGWEEAVAKIGDKEYATLADAIAACEDGVETTIVLLGDVSDNVELPVGVEVKFGESEFAFTGKFTAPAGYHVVADADGYYSAVSNTTTNIDEIIVKEREGTAVVPDDAAKEKIEEVAEKFDELNKDLVSATKIELSTTKLGVGGDDEQSTEQRRQSEESLSIILDALKAKAESEGKDNTVSAIDSDNEDEKVNDSDVDKYLTIKLESAKVETIQATEQQQTTTTTVRSMSYDIKPIAVVTVTKVDENGQTVVETTETVIPNEAIKAPIKFRLPVADDAPFTKATVTRDGEYLGLFDVVGDIGTEGRYIALASDHFSIFEYQGVNYKVNDAAPETAELDTTNYEAIVISGDTAVPYAKLEEAFIAAAGGDRVVLLKNITGATSEKYYIEKQIVFDLNGNTIEGNDEKGIFSVYGGDVTIANGTIKNTATTKTVYAVLLELGATLKVVDVNFVIDVTSSTKYAIKDVDRNSTVNLGNGTYKGAIDVNSVYISGGTFLGKVFAYHDMGISGGTFSEEITYNGANAAVISGGTFEKKITTQDKTISGGKFSAAAKSSITQIKLADDKCWSELKADGYYYVVDAVAEYNGVRYESVAAALKYAGYNNAKAIKLLANTSHYFDPAVIASGEYIALNVNGFDFNATRPAGFEVVNPDGKYSLKLIAPTVDDNEIGGVYSGEAFTSTASSDADGATFKWFKGSSETAFVETATLSVTNVAESGTYTVKAYANGYESEAVTVTVAITKADYDMSGITFENASKPYTGDKQSLEIGGTLPTGADNIQVTVSYSSAGLTNAGDIEITATFATTSGNYNVPEAKTAKLTITKVNATITPINASKIAGNVDPTLTATVTGTVNGETLAYTLVRAEGDAAGAYTISVVLTPDAEVNKNYIIDASKTATFTISASAAKVTSDESTTYYETVEAAYAAAEDGDTLTLLIDTDSFPKIEKGITVDFGDKVVNGKVNVDAAGKTVTFKGTTGGIQPESGSAISVKNGDLVIDSGVYTSKNASLIVKEYGTKSLTVNGGKLTATFGEDYSNSWARFMYGFDGDVTINGGELLFDVQSKSTYYAYFIEISGHTVTVNEGANVVINSKDRATFVYGSDTDVNINGGTIVSNGASRNTLVDDGKNVKISNVNYKATGTVTNYIIDGATKTEVSGGNFDITPVYDTWGKPIEVFGCADTEVSGGTYTVPVSPEKCADGFAPETHVDEQTGKVTYGVIESADPVVAQIIDSNKVVHYYTSLKAAVEAATEGQTVMLMAPVEVPEMIVVNKSITIEPRNNTITSTAANQKLFQIINNATLTVNCNSNYGTDVVITGRFDVGAAPNNNGNLELKYGQYVVDNNTVIHVNGTCTNSNVTLNSAKVTSNGDNAIQMNGAGTLTLKSATVTGATGVYMKAGTLNFESGTIKGNGEYKETIVNHNGSNATGDAIVLDAQDGYKGQISVNIDKTGSAKIESVNGSAIREAVTEGNNSATVSLKISNSKATLTAADGKDAIKVSDKFVAAVKAGTATSAISAGTYSSDVPAVLCEGLYRATKQENGEYKVILKEAVAEVNGKQYTSLAEAFDAVNSCSGDNVTVKILKDVSEPLTDAYMFEKNVTITAENPVTIDSSTNSGKNANGYLIAYKDNGSIVIDSNVTIIGLTSFYAGYGTSNPQIDFYGHTKSTQLWVYDTGTANIKPGALLELGYGDGMIKMRYDSTVNIEGTLTTGQAATAEISSLAASMKQMGGGYFSTDKYGTKTINIKNAYANTGRLGGSGTGKVITTLDNAIFELDNPYNGVCYSTTGEAGQLILKNGSRMIVKGGISFDNNDSATIEAGSIIEATTLTNGGKIIIDASNATEDKYTIIDYTGNDTMELADYGEIEVIGEYAVKVEGNDLVIYKAVAKITVGETTTYYATMSEAVAAVQPGQTIEILAAEIDLPYIITNKDNNKDNITIKGQTDAQGKPVTKVKSVCMPNNQITGNGCFKAANLTIENLIFKDITDSSDKNIGNGNNQVWVMNNTSVDSLFTASNCVFENVAVDVSGGKSIFDSCVFINGSQITTKQDNPKSGPTYALQFYSNMDESTIKNCSFDGATYAIHAATGCSGTVNVIDTTIKGYISAVATATMNFTGVTFNKNAAGWDGLAIGNATFDDCEFKSGTVYIRSGKVGEIKSNCTVLEGKELVDVADTTTPGVIVINGTKTEGLYTALDYIVCSTKAPAQAVISATKALVPVAGRTNTYVLGDAVAETSGIRYATLAEAVAVGGDIKILKDCSAGGLDINATIKVDLNGKTVTLGAASIAAGDKVTIIDNAETKGKLICSGAITVNGTLDVSALGYGETGLVASQSGSLAIGLTGKVALMSAWDSYTAAWLDANSSTFFAGTANGAQIVTPGGSTRFVRVGGRWQVPDAVAQIKRSVGGKEYYDTYATLADAVVAAKNGETIELLVDTAGNGISISKSITIDLDGHTYTVNGNLTGSTGTQTQAFQLLKGNDITIKNGTITTTEDANAAMLIQNYSNLTLTDVNLDGSKLYDVRDNRVPYTLSNNNGNIVLDGTTKITASNREEGSFAYDLYDWASSGYDGITIKIGENVTISGYVEVGGDREVLNIKVTVPDEKLPTAPAKYDWVKDANGVNVLTPAVAKIGDKYYATLEKAVAKAADGDTIELLDDCSGNGIALMAADAKTITIDLGGNTYTVNGELVGSTGTKSQAFHFEKGNTVTIMNGTLATTNARMFMQNYADLTLESVVLDGTGLQGSGRYVLSNNSGNVTIKDTTITANDGDYAFDTCRYGTYDLPTVKVEGNSVINGKVALDGGNLELNGGTLNGELDATENVLDNNASITKAAGFTATAPAGYAWNSEGQLVDAVAKITVGETTTYYATLAEAIAACENGVKTTIVMLGDETIVGNAGVTVAAGQNIVLDLNGKTIKNAVNTDGNSQVILNSGTLTIKDSSDGKTGTITNAVMDGTHPGEWWSTPQYNYVTNAITNIGKLTVESGNIIQTAAGSICYAIDSRTSDWNGSHTVELYVKGGNIVNNGTAEAIRQLVNNDSEIYGDHAHRNNIVEITGGTIDGACAALWIQVTGSNAEGHLSISGGLLKADGNDSFTDWGSSLSNIHYDITGGTFEGTIDTSVKNYISGGTFTEKPDANLFAAGCAPVQNTDGNWVVGECVATITRSGEGTYNYATLAEAVANAADGDTVMLVKDCASGGITIPKNSNFTIDFDSHKVTFNKPGAGSTGTKTIGFQILEGSTIVFKDGTLECSEENKDSEWVSTDAEKGIAMMIQNYANLTLEGMTIDGTNIAHNGVATRYVLSNNSGNVTINNTTITAKTGDYAFDTCKYGSYAVPTVEVKGTSEINGNVELSGGNLALTAGKLNGKLVATAVGESNVTKAEGFEAAAPAEYVWVKKTDSTYKLVDAVAKIGNVYYATLKEAIEAAQSGTTEAEKHIYVIGEAKGYSLNGNYDGIIIEGTDTGKIVSGFTAQGTYGATSLKGVQFLNLKFEGCGIVMSDSCGSVENMLIQGCTFDGKGTSGTAAIQVKKEQTKIDGLKIVNNTIKNYTATNISGIVLNGVAPIDNGKVVISGNTIDNVAFQSIQALNLDGLEITGNKLSNAGSWTHFQLGGSKNVVLSGNEVTYHDGQYVLGIGDLVIIKSDNTFKYDDGSDVELEEDLFYIYDNAVVVLNNTKNETSNFTEGTFIAASKAAVNAVIAPELAAKLVESTEKTYVLGGAVAEVNGIRYSTLAAAIAAAESGDTVKLLADAEGNGITINKNLTIDLNGKTYTVNGNLAGSTGTKTQAFQLLKGNDITIKNGTITTTVEANAALLIQNYSNLTLNNVSLDGSNLRETREGRVPYTLSINNGNVVLAGTTTITASTQAGSFAYDLYDWAPTYSGITMEIGENVTISGNVEVGGTRDVLDISVKAPETKLPAAPAEYVWIDGENGAKVLAPATAYIEDASGNKTYYLTLEKAVAAATDGDTIKLIKSCEGAGIMIVAGKFPTEGLKIDLGGFTYTANDPVGSSGTENQAFHFEKNNKITIENGTIATTGDNQFKFVIQNYSDLKLDRVTLDGSNLGNAAENYVLSVNNGNVELSNTTLKANASDVALDLYDYDPYYEGVKATIGENVTIEGRIEVGGTNVANKGEVTVQVIAESMPAAPAWYAWDKDGKLVNAVAMIGDGAKFYATLAEAVADAQSNDKITLLANAEGAGLFIEKTQDNLTLDLNGKTYTVTSPAVGSTGTETQALHIEAPSFKLIGGTLTSEGEAVKMLVQNYSNLALEHVTLDGSKLSGTGRYVLSNNCGTVTVKDSTIKAKSGDFAMDTCKYGSYDAPAVTLTGSTKLEGDVELSGGKLTIPTGTTVEINGSFVEASGYTAGDVDISGGTFKDQVKLEYCADNFVPTVQNEETGMYSVEQTTKDIVARIINGDNDIRFFTSLKDAIEEAGEGDTVQPLVDLTEKSQGIIIIQPSITLDLNGYKVKADMALIFGSIMDSGDTKGKLIVAQNSFAYMGGCELTMDKDNCPVAYESVIPVWTVANGDDLAGYVFYNITKFDRVWSEKLDTGHPKFTFAPRSGNIANILDENSGVELYVYISYASDGENYQGMHIAIGRELISTYLNDPVGTAISVSFSGVGNITEMRAYAYLKSSQCNFIIKSKTSITTTLN